MPCLFTTQPKMQVITILKKNSLCLYVLLVKKACLEGCCSLIELISVLLFIEIIQMQIMVDVQKYKQFIQS